MAYALSIMTGRDKHRSQKQMGRQRCLADICRIAKKPACSREVATSPRQQTGQKIRFEVVRIVFQHPSQVFSGIREILKLVVKLAKKDSHFAVLRFSRKSPLQSFEAPAVILLDEVLAALFDKLGEATLVLATKRIQKRLLVGLKLLAFLALQQTLGNTLVPVLLQVLLAHDLQPLQRFRNRFDH